MSICAARLARCIAKTTGQEGMIMQLKLPSKIALIEYVIAPWHLRLRWWLEARLWCLGQGFGACEGGTPEQSNPLWRRW